MDKDGNKTGGRVKGTLNKRTEEVIERIEQSELSPIDFDLAVLNWDLESLGLTAEQVKEIDTRTQIEMRQRASDSLKPHAYPKLKAVEVKVDEKEKGRVFTFAYQSPKKANGGD